VLTAIPGTESLDHMAVRQVNNMRLAHSHGALNVVMVNTIAPAAVGLALASDLPIGLLRWTGRIDRQLHLGNAADAWRTSA
jgi:hypothetical protein